MYLPKHYDFDKYMLISKDTGNERTWKFEMQVHGIIRCTKVERMKA